MSPGGIAIDASANVSVTDTSSGARVVKFSSSGSQVGTYGTGYGMGNGQFDIAAYDAVDSGGNLFVSDENNHRIQEFTQAGPFLNAWGTFTSPLGVSVDVAGNVYVADFGMNMMHKYFAGLNPCNDLIGTHLSDCQTAQAACMAKLVPQEEADCLNEAKTQFDPFRGASSKASSATFSVHPGVVPANGAAHGTVTVTLVDASGAPAAGKSVKLTTRLSGVTISPASTTTSSAGT